MNAGRIKSRLHERARRNRHDGRNSHRQPVSGSSAVFGQVVSAKVRRLPSSGSSAPPRGTERAARPRQPSPHPASYWSCSSSRPRHSSSTRQLWQERKERGGHIEKTHWGIWRNRKKAQIFSKLKQDGVRCSGETKPKNGVVELAEHFSQLLLLCFLVKLT